MRMRRISDFKLPAAKSREVMVDVRTRCVARKVKIFSKLSLLAWMDLASMSIPRISLLADHNEKKKKANNHFLKPVIESGLTDDFDQFSHQDAVLEIIAHVLHQTKFGPFPQLGIDPGRVSL
jgi:hypothetical protein